MVNYTANLKESIVIPCNATGIPEPVVSWVKMPNIDIVANDESKPIFSFQCCGHLCILEYRILGTSLGIRNIAPEDDGFYHCIAKSNAGQAIGSRRVTVKLKCRYFDRKSFELYLVPIKDYKVIWVECDEMGNPVKTTYVPARGDVPEDGTNLLPWKQDYQDLPKNGTNGILIRCLPGVRGPRRVPIATAPHFTYSPRSQTVRLGSTVYLHCSAYGPPMPEIVWLKNGDRLAHEQSVEGHSTLRIDVHDTSASGTYVCMAQNVVGASRTQARITVDSNGPNSTEKRENIQHIALLTCFENGIPQREGVTWAIHGDQLNKDDEKIHLMNNGSLVIFDANNVSV
ncbi:unnamed protein product, partial [Anisakis simplex]|uniref:Ig-like domain-containing protein n=1 Tax=Anisakis simplex TaxID=6269 RepID=A0A0M3KEY7_ANISI